MRPTVTVFLKAPLMGRAKTRLARDLGPVEAARIARFLAVRTLRAIGQDPRWRVRVAVAPDPMVTRVPAMFAPWMTGVDCVPQGAGGLGGRMERALRAVDPGPSVIIGTDCPDLTGAHIARAFAALGRHDAVFGPAEDGGFWLVGLARPVLAGGICGRGLFDGVPMSRPDTLSRSLARLKGRASTALIDELTDIDTGADWDRWRRAAR